MFLHGFCCIDAEYLRKICTYGITDNTPLCACEVQLVGCCWCIGSDTIWLSKQCSCHNSPFAGDSTQLRTAVRRRRSNFRNAHRVGAVRAGTRVVRSRSSVAARRVVVSRAGRYVSPSSVSAQPGCWVATLVYSLAVAAVAFSAGRCCRARRAVASSCQRTPAAVSTVQHGK